MKRTLFRSLIALVALLVTYLLAWPVPIDPVAWTPPAAPELTGMYAQNSELAKIERLPIDGFAQKTSLSILRIESIAAPMTAASFAFNQMELARRFLPELRAGPWD